MHAATSEFHGEQGNGDPLARREQHIQFTFIWNAGHLVGQLQKPIRFPAHCRQHDDDLISVLMRPFDSLGDPMNPLDVADGGSPIFLNDQRHNLRPAWK